MPCPSSMPPVTSSHPWFGSTDMSHDTIRPTANSRTRETVVRSTLVFISPPASVVEACLHLGAELSALPRSHPNRSCPSSIPHSRQSLHKHVEPYRRWTRSARTCSPVEKRSLPVRVRRCRRCRTFHIHDTARYHPWQYHIPSSGVRRPI